MSVAIVEIDTGKIQSIFVPGFQDPMHFMHPEPQEPREPVIPEGCVSVPLPADIVTTDAIRVVSQSDPPGFAIVNDDAKLAELRARSMPYIRETRNQLIAMCDWRVMPDSPLSAEKRQEWIAYRQALRDFPATTDPIRPVWPAMPSA